MRRTAEIVSLFLILLHFSYHHLPGVVGFHGGKIVFNVPEIMEHSSCNVPGIEGHSSRHSTRLTLILPQTMAHCKLTLDHECRKPSLMRAVHNANLLSEYDMFGVEYSGEVNHIL